MFGFAQDDWTLGPRLTLNAGLRYDVERMSNLRHYDAPTDTNNLQPRLGAAWEAIPARMVVRGGVGLYTQQHLLGYIESSAARRRRRRRPAAAGARFAVMPVFPSVLSLATLPVLPPRDVRVIDPHFRNPYSMQATIGAEHSLFGMVVGTDFVYLRGFDLMSLVDINAPASISKFTTRTVAQADLTRPIVPVPNGFRKVIALGNEGLSWYRAFELKVDRSVGRIQAVGSYTFAHANDRANDVVNDKLPEDSRNLAGETGPCRQRRAAQPLARADLAGSGVATDACAGSRSRRSGCSEAAGPTRSRSGATIATARRKTTRVPARATPARATRTRRVDVSLAKRFRAANRNFEGRIEAFNILSTVNFDEYVGALSSPFFGQPVSAFPSRAIQLAAMVRF